MYKQYLGKDYHERIRKMLTVDNVLLPNSIINADANLGAMRILMQPSVLKMQRQGKAIDSKENLKVLGDIGVYYLCGVLCIAMKSRTKVEPFNKPKYKKNWDKKRDKYMAKANELTTALTRKVEDENEKIISKA